MPEVRTLDGTGETVITGRTWPLILAGKPTDLAFTAQSGTTTTAVIPVSASPSSVTDAYKGLYFAIVSGTGAGQAAVVVTAYNPATRTITFPVLSTGPNATSVCRLFLAEKFALQNIGDDDLDASTLGIEKNGGSDGWSYMTHAADTDTKSCPYNVEGSVGAGSGVWGSTGIKGIRISAVYGGLETNASLEVRVNVTATTQEITVTWEEDGAPDTIRIYGTETPGTFDDPALVDEISGGLMTYTWDGTAPGAGEPADANLTGGPAPAYGVPPTTLVTTALSLSSGLKVGQQFYYWQLRTFPGGTSSAGNPRTALRRLIETG